MEINKSCKLLLKDVYLYDISACHYQIIQRLGFDLTHIDKEDKLKRNTQIGIMMRDDPRLTSIIRGITNSTIGDFLTKNHVKEEELILRQYDGVITTKLLRETSQNIPLDLRACFEAMLISSDRKTYIAIYNRNVMIKGIPYRYPAMDAMFEKLIKVCNSKKYKIFTTLQEIRDEIITSENPYLYAIPVANNMCNVFLKYFGQTQISKSMIRIMDPVDIDRERYYDFYIRPFAESLVMEFA